jgi:nitronate monooxygenase
LITSSDKVKISKCHDCLKNCSYRFCTLDSMYKVMEGDIENGLVFAGARVDEIKEILPVQQIMNQLTEEYQMATI